MAIQALMPIITSLLGSALGGGSNKGGGQTTPSQPGPQYPPAGSPGGPAGPPAPQQSSGGGSGGLLGGILGGLGTSNNQAAGDILGASKAFHDALDARRRYKEAQYFMPNASPPQINYQAPANGGLGGMMLARILGLGA